ncbi:hypothetical protein D3C71_302180 [compost metagenome]
MTELVPLRYNGAMQKYYRGADHLDDIAKKTNAYEQSNPSRMDSEEVDGEKLYRVYFDKPAPAIGCEVGDFLHNMRSALDVATCTLVELYAPCADLGQVQFPISEGAQLNAREKSRVLDIPVAVEVMQAIRDRSHSALLALRDLSNQDKHRLISTVVVRAQAASIIIDETTNTASIHCSPDVEPQLWNTPLKSGDVIGRNRLPGIGVNFPLALLVDDQPIKLTVLNEILQAVSDILHYLTYGAWPEDRLPQLSSDSAI